MGGDKRMLDDSTHVILAHGDKLDPIWERMRGIEVCAMSDCPITRRHFAPSNTEHSGDQILNFYIQTMDSLYFCANRSVEAGFRCKPTTQQEEKQNDDELFDAEFARMNLAIRKSDLLTEPFDRIHSENNSKYSLVIRANEHHGDTTFCDELAKHLADDA